MASIYLAVVGGICLLCILFINEIVALLLPSNYHDASRFAAPVFLGSLAIGLYYFASAPLHYANKTKLIPILTGTVACVNIGLNLWLIPSYGAIAAAWTTLFCNSLMCFLFFCVSQSISRIRYPINHFSIPLGIIYFTCIFLPQSFQFNLVLLLFKIGILLIYLFSVYYILLSPYIKNSKSTL